MTSTTNVISFHKIKIKKTTLWSTHHVQAILVGTSILPKECWDVLLSFEDVESESEPWMMEALKVPVWGHGSVGKCLPHELKDLDNDPQETTEKQSKTGYDGDFL